MPPTNSESAIKSANQLRPRRVYGNVRSDDRPFPAVVAPVINATVREHFDRWGIEYYEISEAMFRRVATERGVEMEQAEPTASATEAMAEGIQRGTRALSSKPALTPAGNGPLNGWYNLQSNATQGRWSDPANWIWHYRIDGTTACGAHRKAATAERTDAAYVEGAKPPNAPGTECQVCARAAKDSSAL